jgi:hypothetical protein
MRVRRGLFLLALLTGPACVSEPCDPGQTYRHGLCYPDVDAQGAPGADAGDPFAHYGDPCADTSECDAPTDYCALQPGQPTGYCTHTGCLEDESVCPDGWDCLDLSVFNPTLPSICSQP